MYKLTCIGTLIYLSLLAQRDLCQIQHRQIQIQIDNHGFIFILDVCPCLIATSYSSSEIPTSHHLPPIYLTIQLYHTYIIVSELLTHSPHEKQHYQLECCYVRLLLYLVFSFSFSMLLKSVSFGSAPTVRLFYAFVIRLGNVTFHISSWDTLKFTVLSSKVQWGLTNTWCHVFTTTAAYRIILLP